MPRISRRNDGIGDPSTWTRFERASLDTAAPLRQRSAHADERFADERLVHDADDRLRAVVQRNERAPMQLTEDEAPRPVDRVDHPCLRRRAARAAELFAENAVRRIGTGDLVPDQ